MGGVFIVFMLYNKIRVSPRSRCFERGFQALLSELLVTEDGCDGIYFCVQEAAREI